MRNVKLKTALFLVLGLSVLLFIFIIGFSNIERITLKEILFTIPKVVTIDLLVLSLFASEMWKWGVFRPWLVPFPDLNGTWAGEIQSTWIDPVTGTRPGPIPVILTIKQSFFAISCVMRTAEMVSRSVISDFDLDPTNQVKRLIYSYESKPHATVRERSPEHFGTMYFDISEDPVKHLSGEYWTARKTTGRIELRFWSEDHYDYFPSNLGDHPVSSKREFQS